MKKLLLTVFMVLIATTVFAGGTINTSISASGFVAVRLPANVRCTAYSLWTEDGAKWEFATESDGSDAIDVTSDGTNVLPIAVSLPFGASAAGTIICYAKGTSTTNLVGIPIR